MSRIIIEGAGKAQGFIVSKAVELELFIVLFADQVLSEYERGASLVLHDLVVLVPRVLLVLHFAIVAHQGGLAVEALKHGRVQLLLRVGGAQVTGGHRALRSDGFVSLGELPLPQLLVVLDLLDSIQQVLVNDVNLGALRALYSIFLIFNEILHT